MRFSRKQFFDGYRKHFGSLSQQQTVGLTILLDHFEADQYLARIEWPAYMLATAKRETAGTYMPIHEYGSKAYFIKRYGGQTRKGKELGNDTPDEGWIYAGEGDVQLTGESNFEKAENALRDQYPEIVAAFEARTGKKFDLTVGDQPGDINDPKNAQDPDIAYAIMSYGMRTGMFTTKRLPMTGRNYTAWRGIINGTDHAEDIAADAVAFEKILKDCLIDMNLSETAIHTAVPATQEEPKATEIPSDDSEATEAIETAPKDMPQSAAPPQNTQQTTDVQVSGDTTAITANTKVGGFKWLWLSIIGIVTGQATVPEFVSNGLQSTSFWTVILNIFQNLWTFRKWIIAGVLIIFIVRKAEVVLLKIAAMHVNSDPTRGNVVLTEPVATNVWQKIRGMF